jgi:hypothetical protein
MLVRAEIGGWGPRVAAGVFDGGGAVALRSVLWGDHRNGSRANGLRVERVGVRHVDVQVGGHQLEFPMSFVEKAAPKVHRLTRNSKGQKKNEIVMDHRWLQRLLTEQ